MANKITLEKDRRRQETFRRLRKAIKEGLLTPGILEEKKSLTQIVGGAMAFAAVGYPICAGFYALSPDVTFVEKLKDPKTAGFAIGMGIGYFVFHGAKELVKRYKFQKT